MLELPVYDNLILRFNGRIRARKEPDRTVSYLDSLDQSSNCGGYDVTVLKNDDDFMQWKKRVKTCSIVCTCIKPGEIPDSLDLHETYEMKMEDFENPSTPLTIGWHINVLPKSEMRSNDFDAIICAISKPCLFKAKGINKSTLLPQWPAKARLPSDRKMEMVSAAMLRFSKRAMDPNDAFFAYLYHHHITAIDMTLEKLLISKGYLQRIVAASIDAYLPADHGDHHVLCQIKYALQLALPGYVPVVRFQTSPSTSDDDDDDDDNDN